jgi:hypothetical protein
MAKTKDVRAVVATYEQNGEEKKRYATVGALFEGEKGMVCKLDLIPTHPDWDGTLFFNDPYEVQKEQFDEGIQMARQTLEGQPVKQAAEEIKKELEEDDIPF